MRKSSLFFALACVLGFAAAACAEPIDGISVAVNDSVVTAAEIELGTMDLIRNMATRYQADPQAFERERDQLRKEEVDALVERLMIIHEFTAGGYSTNVLQAIIDSEIKDKIQKDFYGDRARLIKTLQAEGRTYEMFRKQQRDNFIVDYMRHHYASPQKVIISPLKIELYYNEHKDDFKVEDEVKLRMIVIPQPNSGPTDATRKFAQETLDKINAGVPFSEMASEVYSVTAVTSQRANANGGDRGWVDKTYLKPELSKVAFSLSAGQHSGVVDLPEACYLLLVEDRKTAHVRPMSEVHTEIEAKLEVQEARRLYERWIDRLKAKSFVKYYN